MNHDNHFSIDDTNLRAVYEAGLKMPYCSVTPVYLVAGECPPPEVGDNCIAQAAKVADILEVKGALHRSFVHEGRHHAVVCECNNDLYYFDPYLMHAEPINLTSIYKSKSGKRSFDAYPSIADKHGAIRKGHLVVRFDQNVSCFNVEKFRFDYVTDEYHVARFSFDLGKKKVQRPPGNDYDIAFASEQTSLSLRLLNQDNGSVNHIVYPIAETHPFQLIDKRKIYIKNRIGLILNWGEVGYTEELNEMALQVGLAGSDIEDFIMHGVSLYEKLAPRHLQHASTNPTNQ